MTEDNTRPRWKEITRKGLVQELEIVINGSRVVIHHHMDYEPDVWFLSSFAQDIRRKKLINKDLKKAKDEALSILRADAFNIIDDIDSSRRPG